MLKLARELLITLKVRLNGIGPDTLATGTPPGQVIHLPFDFKTLFTEIRDDSAGLRPVSAIDRWTRT